MKKTAKKPASKTDNARLRESLLAQPLACHRADIVDWLISKKVKLEKIKAHTVLLKENDFDDRDVFCIVSGRFTIDVGGNVVRDREKNIHIGEMAMILEEGRTASATAAEDSTVVRIPQKTMREMYEKFPETWKPVAKTLCDRLHQRRRFFRVKNELPKVFIGSSGASLGVAKQLATQLRKKVEGKAVVEVWDGDSIFLPSTVTIHQLIERAKLSDFGIFIFAADDKAEVKGTNKAIPRDNVIFEGGLFTAACGLSRTFFVCEDDKNLHIPTDLAGVTYLGFSKDASSTKAKFGTTTGKLAKIICDLKEL